MGACLLRRSEETGGFDDILGSGIGPLDICWVFLTMNSDGLVVDVQLAVLGDDATLEAAVHL